MLFREIKLSNFKGIDEEVSIPLAPITLLFGGNSVGKSTVLQSLLYLYELLVNKDTDPITSVKQGRHCLLNGFENLVHKKDLTREVSIEVKLDISDVILNSYLTESDEQYIESSLDQRDSFVLNEPSVDCVSLRFVIAHNQTEPFLKSLFIKINGEIFSELKQEANSPNIWMFVEPESVELLDEIYGDSSISNIIIEGIGGRSFVNLTGSKSLLDIFDSSLSVANNNWNTSELFSANPRVGKIIGEAILSQLICEPINLLRKELSKLCHIGPIRTTPVRGYAPSKIPQDWYSGLAGWDHFAYSSQQAKDRVNDCFGSAGFNTKYSFKVDGKYNNISVYDHSLNIENEPSELGIGISQVFPFVVAACDRKTKLLSIEQPELHIHPGWQLTVGDILIKAMKDSSDRMFLVETHSEELMLRLLSRVRWDESEEKFDSSLVISPEDLSVVCVYQNEGKPYYQRQHVTLDGDFELDWPEGFFEERYGEV
ncbi:AAA family ATPase [Vibrio caribbeanicus]|uniref:AAA family ATPase n=1 Tax=Vibrio caribbeanicus TaxID=701175 RepID=UPI00228402A3|nr:AAA family ATPase [Vibrio caribbeanicus]MCY9844561.1 AAA family ATPase [Vibrio caribbeanicus]